MKLPQHSIMSSAERKHGRLGSWRWGNRCSLFIAYCSFLLLALSAFAQAPPPAGPRIITQGGNIIFQANPAGQLDPGTAALMQQMGMDPNATAQVEFDPPVITLGQRATYRVVVTAMIEGVSLPEDLPVPAGLKLTLAGRGFNYGNLGGLGVQPRTTFNYRVAVTNVGTFVMPSYQASANGKPLKVPEARLTVMPAGSPVAKAASARLQLELDDSVFYIGQAVLVRLVMLDPGDNTIQAISQPQVTGDAFIAENWTTRYRREMRPQPDGRVVAANICEVFAFPIKAGSLQLSATAYAHIRRGPIVPGQPLAMDSVMVDSDPVAVMVQHVPKEGELPGFTGGIGAFAVDPPKPSTNVVRAGEPLTLSVTVRGEGNLTRLVPPRLDHPLGWQSFAPSADASGAMQIQLRGFVTFTYTLIPMSDRVQATPAIPFSCFDPKKKSYVDLTIPPAAVQVLPAPGGTLQQLETARTAKPSVDDPDRSNTDRDLVLTGLAETPGHATATLVPLQKRVWFLALQLVPAVVLGGLWVRERRRRFLASHPEVVLKARARRGMRRQLRLARQAAASRDAGGFVNAAVNALREASAPRAAAHPGALVCADVLEALPPPERHSKEGQLVSTLFTAADAQRFEDQAPDGPALLALQPEVEGLLEKWRARL